MEEISDVVHPGFGHGVRAFAWLTLLIIVGAMVGILVAFFVDPDDPRGEPGDLEEEAVPPPPGLEIPRLTDATAEWGLDGWRTQGADPLRGGATLHDLDGDGDLDLAVAGGGLAVHEWRGAAFARHEVGGSGDAIAVRAGDVDGDGAVDLLVGRSDGAAVHWGTGTVDGWTETTDLPVDGLVTGVIPLDLDGAGRIQLLVLGYGGDDATADLLFPVESRTLGTPVELPDSRRKSMVAEIGDVDGDGLADIWVGRDVGWATGGDSVYSRQGRPDGPWVDVAAELGAALEIDAMGLTLADLSGDGQLDAYLSDLGDNEYLVRGAAGFERTTGIGAARIRSADADDNEISSSWGSGAVDLNQDGRLDLVVVNGGFAEISVPNKVVNTFILEDDPPAILLATGEGTFTDAWPLLDLEWTGRSRGLALGDVDDDGDTDLIVVDHGGGLHALRNEREASSSRHRAPPTCLPSGAQARWEGPAGEWSVLVHQQSFLGAHAPEVLGSLDGRLEVEDPACEP